MTNNEESIASEVISASIGGAISASALYPLEILKTKVQAADNTTKPSREENDNGNEEKNTTLSLAKSIYKSEGWHGFYSGVHISALQSALEKSLYFFAYTALKKMHTSITGRDRIDTFTNLVLGYLADWAHLTITLPIDCWTTNIQTCEDKTQTKLGILMHLLSEKGLAGMYKGIQAYTILCLKPAIQYTVFEQVKRILLLRQRTSHSNKQRQLSAKQSFLLGMISRAVATVCIFPYLRAKVLIQNAKHSDPSNDIPSMLRQTIRENGVRSLFQGIGPELTRGVLSAAFLMMIKEQISFGVNAMLHDIFG